MTVVGGSVTVKDCDLRGRVTVMEGAKLLLQKCTVHDSSDAAVYAEGKVVVQDCIMEDSQRSGMQVEPTGDTGLLVDGKATVGKATVGCSITTWGAASSPQSTRAPVR